ncbi:VOC family protein [Mesonia aestuariivivens]|uniref:VOC family protein n=1 Tax=Mesonia aestuariivivens TaxID=2796128 RepID=A0ABS6W2Y0_9FLAO|nr:VOC family protein [Mesonia aestuariivivens]MBW2962169.1 VOC family protein [Mesonia aestuariivivens]
MKEIQPFHLAIPVDNLKTARSFYSDVLELSEGRSDEHWVDFNFFGHQLVIHHKEKEVSQEDKTNLVDGKQVPVPHFGVVLTWEDFHLFSKKLQQKKVAFEIEPYIRFKGTIGEQATMFFYDPCGNALEFKAFKDQRQLFAN